MAAIHDLLAQVQDEALRNRLEQEINRLTKTKKFGLVFEEHLPECTPLYDIPVKKGSTVAKKTGAVNEMYEVNSINDGIATCYHKVTEEKEEIPVDELVCVAQFGEPIYPYLKPIDSVCNAPDSDLWHTLIEADNYHALQLLEYLYAGKVDCIYIDPPYNTGAKDWKYNNDYVDSADSYRHSKWLSFIQKRLKIARKLLNPKDSVLIVTIDEKEYLHLGCILEDLFPDATIQMVSTIINPKGVSALHGFKRADEYIFFVMFGESTPAALALGNEWAPSALKANTNKDDSKKAEKTEPGWTSMMRRGSHSSRNERPGLYYAIYADPEKHMIVKVGNVLPLEKEKDEDIEGMVQILPIRSNGDKGCWQVGPQELLNRIKQGRVRLGRETSYGFVVNYLPDGEYNKVLNGDFTIEKYAEDGSMIAFRNSSSESDKWVAPTQWKIASHDASAYGSTLLSSILSGKRFAFPKSLYAVEDTLNFFVANNRKALIVDFFAGSGTTLHAVNLLNQKDGGERRCIMVTNNEVSEDEAKRLSKMGIQPGDPGWESIGISRYVTWPRTVCTINGKDVNGNPLKGYYIGTEVPMSNGFRSNAVYFKLGFLDKTSIALGRQLAELFPVLWLKAGAHGVCPVLKDDNSVMQILPENQFAILIDEKHFLEFKEEVDKYPEIQTIYIITDSEPGYREMIRGFSDKDTYQLYRDYLDNFRINTGRIS